MPDPMEDRKARAAAWFAELRDRITAAFEAIEGDLPPDAPGANLPAGSYAVSIESRKTTQTFSGGTIDVK